MQVIRDVSGFVGMWASGLLDNSIPEGSMSMGVIDDSGKLIGAVVIVERTADNTIISVCGTTPRWAQRHILEEMFGVLFNDMGKKRLTCMVSVDNERSLKFTRGIGWQQEGVLRKAGSEGEDLVVFGMLKEECEYLPPDLDGTT